MNLLVASLLFLSLPITALANHNLLGDYELKAGSPSCERVVSVNKVENGLRFLATRKIGTIFESEGAGDLFVNINMGKMTITDRNSSHGTKYITDVTSTLKNNILRSKGVLREYNFGIKTSKINFAIDLILKGETLNYSKTLSGSVNWTRNCIYLKLR